MGESSVADDPTRSHTVKEKRGCRATPVKHTDCEDDDDESQRRQPREFMYPDNQEKDRRPLSAYELLRLRNIAERQKRWEELFKTSDTSKPWLSKPTRVVKRRRVPLRRHRRCKGRDDDDEDDGYIPERMEPVLTRSRAKREGLKVDNICLFDIKRCKGRRIIKSKRRRRQLVPIGTRAFCCAQTPSPSPTPAGPNETAFPPAISSSFWHSVAPVCEVVRSSSGRPTIYRIYLSEVKNLIKAVLCRLFRAWLC
jgi:hypothetical protein